MHVKRSFIFYFQAFCGFRNIDVIDMDTIDVSNLNRQFLFRLVCKFRALYFFTPTWGKPLTSAFSHKFKIHAILFCRSKDVGKTKATVAAEFINNRIEDCQVTPYPLSK